MRFTINGNCAAEMSLARAYNGGSGRLCAAKTSPHRHMRVLPPTLGADAFSWKYASHTNTTSHTNTSSHANTSSRANTAGRGTTTAGHGRGRQPWDTHGRTQCYNDRSRDDHSGPRNDGCRTWDHDGGQERWAQGIQQLLPDTEGTWRADARMSAMRLRADRLPSGAADRRAFVRTGRFAPSIATACTLSTIFTAAARL